MFEQHQELLQELIQNTQIAILAELREKGSIVMPEVSLPPATIRADSLLDQAD